MNFEKVNKEWLNNWDSKEITKDAFITANSFSNKCIKQIGIKPHYCIKKLGKDCKTCWEYVYSAMWKRQMLK